MNTEKIEVSNRVWYADQNLDSIAVRLVSVQEYGFATIELATGERKQVFTSELSPWNNRRKESC